MLKLKSNLVPETTSNRKVEEPSQEMMEKLKTLTVLGQSLLNYQTNVRVVPMELPRSQLQNAINHIITLEKKLSNT